MNRFFHRTVRLIGRIVFRVASDPKVLHVERARRSGAYLIAANHEAPYDAPLIIAVTPRIIHWLSVVEIFRTPFGGWFMRRFGALPLDRARVDTKTVLQVARLLKGGEVVGIFPEGRLRRGETSVLGTGKMDDGVCQLAQLAGVPVLPCVVLGGDKFRRWTSWLPGARTRWAVAFGEPVYPRWEPDRATACAAMTQEITHALRALGAEVAAYV